MVIVVALLAVVLIANRVAVICAQDRLARQIQDRGFSGKPHVTIAGFPFLTQAAARRLDKVVIRAAGKKLGPLEVRHLDLTLHGMRGLRPPQDCLPACWHRPGQLRRARRDDRDASAHAGRRRP